MMTKKQMRLKALLYVCAFFASLFTLGFGFHLLLSYGFTADNIFNTITLFSIFFVSYMIAYCIVEFQEFDKEMDHIESLYDKDRKTKNTK